MSQIGNIVINDGKATPVAHTFNPVQSSPIAIYREALSTLPLIGNAVIELRPSMQGDLNKVKIVLAVPVLETQTGANAQGYTAAPKVAYVNKVNMEFFLPSRGTGDQRKDLRVLASNLLKDAQIVDLIDNINVPY